LDREKRNHLNRLRQNIKKGQRYLSKLQARLNSLKESVSNQTKADMLMAYMHMVPTGADEVELPHFETNELITIKLKSALTPQKNAEYYYRKEKNQKKELSVLQESIAAKQRELENWKHQVTFVESCQDLKALRQFLPHKITEKDHQSQEALFKTYEYEGYTIWIGRNAKNNDLLTQKHAHKEDMWLHAKDVRGSHVVIKHKSGEKFPARVIERAAELAAYYSKRKHDSLCPVTYTSKKYVRKSKGMLPGQVKVEREQVLLVEPKA
jgi:predicted ribosome quality control (RQC) complex YloA/Tae2 family protein